MDQTYHFTSNHDSISILFIIFCDDVKLYIIGVQDYIMDWGMKSMTLYSVWEIDFVPFMISYFVKSYLEVWNHCYHEIVFSTQYYDIVKNYIIYVFYIYCYSFVWKSQASTTLVFFKGPLCCLLPLIGIALLSPLLNHKLLKSLRDFLVYFGYKKQCMLSGASLEKQVIIGLKKFSALNCFAALNFH